jgi:hypothetical protein
VAKASKTKVQLAAMIMAEAAKDKTLNKIEAVTILAPVASGSRNWFTSVDPPSEQDKAGLQTIVAKLQWNTTSNLDVSFHTPRWPLSPFVPPSKNRRLVLVASRAVPMCLCRRASLAARLTLSGSRNKPAFRDGTIQNL